MVFQADELFPAGGTVQDVIIDTDVGSDVDDAYALLFATRSPELNIKGVTVVHGGVDLRAKIGLKLLRMAGRPDISVYLGEDYPINRERPVYWTTNDHGIDFIDIEDAFQRSQENPRAPEFIARTAAENPGSITLVTIGPLTNAAAAIRDYPSEMALLKGMVVMAASFKGMGREHGVEEYNAAVDPEATEIVANSGIPTLMVGLNVTLQTLLTPADVEKIAAVDTPLADLMVKMTEGWFVTINQQFTNMHDPLAVALVFAPDLVSTVPAVPMVDADNPRSVYFLEPKKDCAIQVCTTVDVERFNLFFFPRIMDAVAGD